MSLKKLWKKILSWFKGSKSSGGGFKASDLNWCWGGLEGSKAEEVKDAVVKDLSVSNDRLTYKWANGGCEKLGASSKEDYSHTVACLFCKLDGKWKGGKWEYVSTSRTMRAFDNIKSGYNGWDKKAVEKSKEFAFCIISTNGKKRTNIITFKR